MTIANNDAPSVGKNADDFRALAVVLERIELRVDALLSAAAVRALNGARRSAQEDPVRPSWLQPPDSRYEVHTVRQMLLQERDDPVDALGVDQVVVVEDDGPLLVRDGGEIVYQRADQRFDLRRLGRAQQGENALPHAP